MAVEIERKYLVKNDSWKNTITKSLQIKQGFLSTDKNRVVRIRVQDDTAWLTIKGKTENISRQEFEYRIPLEDANKMLAMCDSIIEKTRHLVLFDSLTWEIDVFAGENEGLIVAEIELQDENQAFKQPTWLGKEVSHDKRYFNAYLAEHPFTQ